jgi:putative lipoprotein (rSAM/lipoprotein system)
MKARLLTRVNAFIALLMGVLGFGSCESHLIAEYGCPHATLEVSGTITDESNQPVENIQVKVKSEGRQITQEAYSNADGQYTTDQYAIFPVSTVDLIVTDTAGVYEGDSVRMDVTYDKSQVAKGDHWDEGDAVIQYDFQLKKK